MRTLFDVSRIPSPWRPRDLHVAGVIVDAWDEQARTFDWATEQTNIGRNRLQKIRAKAGTAISVGEAWALCLALDLDALDVLDGGPGVGVTDELAERRRKKEAEIDESVKLATEGKLRHASLKEIEPEGP